VLKLEIDIEPLQRLATQVGIASQQSQLFQNLQTELADRKQAEQKIQEQAALPACRSVENYL
jgi:two-component system, cell cycle sensor histidine kinase and response regulator CckA